VSKGYTSFREGDVLFAKITPSMENGKAAIALDLVNGFGFGSTEFHVFRSGSLVLAEWIFALIRQSVFRAAAKRSFVGTAGQQRGPTNFIENFEIPLPPLPEQQRIVAILRQADALRQQRRAANGRARDLLPALFQEMFGRKNIAELRWKRGTVSDVGEVKYGLTVNRQRRNANEEYPYLRVANVYRWSLDLSEIANIGILEGDLEKYSLEQNDILVVEGHANPTQLGRAAVWNGEIPTCLHQNHLLRIRPDPDMVTSNYLAGYINSAAGREHMLRFGKTSSGLNTINSSVLAEMPLLIPPLSLQQEFEKRYRFYKQCLQQYEKLERRLDELFNSLLAHAFTGELTATWRTAHAEELAAAARERDRLLDKEPVVISLESGSIHMTGHLVTAVVKPHRPYLVDELSDLQRQVLGAVRAAEAYVTAETLIDETNLPPEAVRRGLVVLAAAGLIQRISVETNPTGAAPVYVEAFRPLHPDDQVRLEDMAPLGIRP